MILPSFEFIFDRHKRGCADKPATIDLRIIYNREVKYISTGLRVFPRHWRRGRVVNLPDAPDYNNALDAILQRARSLSADMISAGTLNLKELTRRLRSSDKDNNDFLAFAEERTKVRTYGLAPTTKSRYMRFLRFLRKWGGIKSFGDITEAKILEMDELLAARGMKSYSIYVNYHRFLKSFTLDAIADGRMQINPYRRLKLDTHGAHSLQKFLTLSELQQFTEASMPSASIERVRDLFVFQTYTCLSYADLADFDTRKIRREGDHLYYTGKRDKTGQEFSFLLFRPAAAILEKYDGHLPIISNVKYNAYLKVAAQAAGIDKPITTHWARHTGATLLLNAGVDMEVVARILGHSSTHITREVYAKLLDKTIQKEMAKVEANLLGI